VNRKQGKLCTKKQQMMCFYHVKSCIERLREEGSKSKCTWSVVRRLLQVSKARRTGESSFYAAANAHEHTNARFQQPHHDGPGPL